jgi:hypothetical protein
MNSLLNCRKFQAWEFGLPLSQVGLLSAIQMLCLLVISMSRTPLRSHSQDASVAPMRRWWPLLRRITDSATVLCAGYNSMA